MCKHIRPSEHALNPREKAKPASFLAEIISDVVVVSSSLRLELGFPRSQVTALL